MEERKGLISCIRCGLRGQKQAQVTEDGQELPSGRRVLLTGGPWSTNMMSLGVHMGGERLGES